MNHNRHQQTISNSGKFIQEAVEFIEDHFDDLDLKIAHFLRRDGSSWQRSPTNAWGTRNPVHTAGTDEGDDASVCVPLVQQPVTGIRRGNRSSSLQLIESRITG